MAVITGAFVEYTDYSAPGTPRILHIPDAWGDVTVQDAWDTLSEIEADLDNLIYTKLIDRPKGGGKGTLSVTKQGGITLMQNNIKIKFADQPGPDWVIKRVVDGNAIAQDHLEVAMEALANSDFTNWKNEADVSAAIVGVDGMTAAQDAKLTDLHDEAIGDHIFDPDTLLLTIKRVNGSTLAVYDLSKYVGDKDALPVILSRAKRP